MEKEKTELVVLVLKTVGALIIIISFCTQNFIYAKLDSLHKDSWEGVRDQSLADHGALLNKILFFTAHWDSTEEKELGRIPSRNSFIIESARKTFYAKLNWILSSNMTKEEKSKYADSLNAQLKTVVDYPTFSKYLGYINYLDAKYLSRRIDSRYFQNKASKELTQNIYLALYLFGALLVTLAGYFEIKFKVNAYRAIKKKK